MKNIFLLLKELAFWNCQKECKCHWHQVINISFVEARLFTKLDTNAERTCKNKHDHYEIM